jgi:F420-dependent oxidoreductase-like protein
MKLSQMLMYSGNPRDAADEVVALEQAGLDTVWVAEAYGFDSPTLMGYLAAKTETIEIGAAILNVYSRTPGALAQTAAGLDNVSGGRAILGLGASGPQVIEGWHGVRFGKPMQRTKEYIAIIKQVLAREKPLEFHGSEYSIPYDGPDASGLGKPLRSIAHGDPNVPFYTASITPAGLRMAGEVADGNLPIFFSPDAPDVVTGPTLEGRRKVGKTMEGFDTAPFVRAKMGPDVAACRDAIRPELALYIGGMGARSKNFYNDMITKMGFEGEARAIQDFYLDGKKNEAAAAVPDALIDAISLCGPAERIRDRLAAWKDVAKAGHVGTMVLKGSGVDVLRVVAEAVL